MINLGTSTMQDFALGDNLVERIDLGDTTIFDPYTTLTGTLPLTFNSRAAVALKNYRIHGTSAGAGVETENVLINEPYKTNYYITENGQEYAIDGFNIYVTKTLDTSLGEYSFYFTVYQLNTTVRVHGYSNGVWQQQITTFSNIRSITITKPQGIDEIRISCAVGYTGRTLVEGSTAPTTYIPFGYKIPILLNITKTEYSATSRTIEQGRYSTNQGSEITGIADTTKIRLSSYTLVSYNDTLVIDASVRANIDCSIIFTDVNNVVVASTAWVSLPYTRTINYKNVKKCYVVFCKTNDSSISPSDVGTVAVTYKPVNSSNYDLFVGGSKLYADEYLDFGEQKMYKNVSGVLTPTDPPAPLPAINTYKGENTLSSTETLGEVTVKGRISAISP